MEFLHSKWWVLHSKWWILYWKWWTVVFSALRGVTATQPPEDCAGLVPWVRQWVKMMNFVSHCVLKTRNCASETRNCVSKNEEVCIQNDGFCSREGPSDVQHPNDALVRHAPPRAVPRAAGGDGCRGSGAGRGDVPRVDDRRHPVRVARPGGREIRCVCPRSSFCFPLFLLCFTVFPSVSLYFYSVLLHWLSGAVNFNRKWRVFNAFQ